ncbi:hypothetical protein ANN_21649 [Periplaneta americana]|uniref:Uncharacterized protein n=1 Tax=Periplaneta americana TaxID=6978 RepID=A0ABQ8S6T9_PERAM|nr:hypothetical protein ANN_21649 [Periplaneta americana]
MAGLCEGGNEPPGSLKAIYVLLTFNIRSPSVAVYGTETWTLRRSEVKRLEAFEMWIWRRMEHVKWTDIIRNKAVLERVGEERMMLKLITKRKRNWLGHWLRRNCLLKDALEGMVNRRRVRAEEDARPQYKEDAVRSTSPFRGNKF